MKQLIFSLLFTVALAFGVSQKAYAGTEGHGGGGVVCFNSKKTADQVKENNGTLPEDFDISKITFVEVLDLFDAKAGGTSPIIEIEQGETYDEYSERIVKRFDKLLPSVAQVMRKGRDNYPLYQRKSKKLFKVWDINPPGPLKDNCVYATLMNQDGHRLYIDPRFFDVDPNVPSVSFDVHSKSSRAVTYIHEWMRYHTHADSDARRTRYMVEFLIRRIDGVTLEDLKKEARKLGLLKCEYITIEETGEVIALKPCSFVPGPDIYMTHILYSMAEEIDLKPLDKQNFKPNEQLEKEIQKFIQEVGSREFRRIGHNPSFCRGWKNIQSCLSVIRRGLIAYRSNSRIQSFLKPLNAQGTALLERYNKERANEMRNLVLTRFDKNWSETLAETPHLSERNKDLLRDAVQELADVVLEVALKWGALNPDGSEPYIDPHYNNPVYELSQELMEQIWKTPLEEVN